MTTARLKLRPREAKRKAHPRPGGPYGERRRARAATPATWKQTAHVLRGPDGVAAPDATPLAAYGRARMAPDPWQAPRRLGPGGGGEAAAARGAPAAGTLLPAAGAHVGLDAAGSQRRPGQRAAGAGEASGSSPRGQAPEAAGRSGGGQPPEQRRGVRRKPETPTRGWGCGVRGRLRGAESATVGRARV